MDHYSASTPSQALTNSLSDAKENQDPNDIRMSMNSSVLVPKVLRNEKVPTFSNTNDASICKHRRALHNRNNTYPKLQAHSLSCSQLNASSCIAKDAVEAKQMHKQLTTSRKALKAVKTADKASKADHKRSSVVLDYDMEYFVDASSPLSHEESENLAWMDMMLALLEKRYDANSTLPVCLTDLEDANTFQLPKHKKLKTDISATKAPFLSKRSLDVTKFQTSSTMLATQLQQIAVRFGHEQEKTDAKKRQRLLLRHAQQIQVSTVSSSTSCGCKTGCLKMYCMCFSSRGFCHSGCTCDDCKNDRTNETERVEAIQNYLANDPRAFSYASLPQDTYTSGFLHLLPQKSSAVVMRGCRCKKSKCLKKYCECFQNGIVCTSHCRCMDCSNQNETSHLQSTPAHGKHTPYGSVKTPSLKPFHFVQITVTKQPRRNYVGKTIRLILSAASATNRRFMIETSVC